MKRTVVIGMMAEIVMKAKILRKKLSDNPNDIVEILCKINRLEDDMLFCLEEFEKSLAK